MLSLANNSGNTLSIVLWSAVLIAMVVVSFFVIMAIKKYAEQADTTGEVPFTLEDLRQMHRAGQLTDEEYEKARQQVIGMVSRAQETAPADDATVSDVPAQENNDEPVAFDDEPPDNDATGKNDPT